MLGGHTLGVTGLRLTKCPVPKADMLFGPGDGFKAAMRGINMARTFVGAGCCGILNASLKTALAHGAKRHAFGKPILSFQDLQWELADVAADLEAARPDGLRTENPFARHLAMAKMTQYMDGATGIQNIVNSRTLLKEHGLDVG